MSESPSVIEPCLLEPLPRWAEPAFERLTAETERSPIGFNVFVEDAIINNQMEGIETDEEAVRYAISTGIYADDACRMAVNHIRLLIEMDHRNKSGSLENPMSADFVCWLHESLFRGISDEMLIVGGGYLLRPGMMRSTDDEAVSVGRHIAPSGSSVRAIMDHAEKRYGTPAPRSAAGLLAAAAAHHRFGHIHPFIDGNGRVSRLMTTGMLMRCGLGAGTAWSLCKALTNASNADYWKMMQTADEARRGDLDGRGNLSAKALEEFCAWFIEACSDEIICRLRPAAKIPEGLNVHPN